MLIQLKIERSKVTALSSDSAGLVPSAKLPKGPKSGMVLFRNTKSTVILLVPLRSIIEYLLRTKFEEHLKFYFPNLLLYLSPHINFSQRIVIFKELRKLRKRPFILILLQMNHLQCYHFFFLIDWIKINIIWLFYHEHSYYIHSPRNCSNCLKLDAHFCGLQTFFSPPFSADSDTLTELF